MTKWRQILSWDTTLPEPGTRVRMLAVGAGHRTWGSALEGTRFTISVGGEGSIVGAVSRFSPWLDVVWDDNSAYGRVYVRKDTVQIL